jgi:G3E family GTPase
LLADIHSSSWSDVGGSATALNTASSTFPRCIEAGTNAIPSPSATKLTIVCCKCTSSPIRVTHPAQPAVEQLKLRQIAFADMMILNKVDLAGPEAVKKVRVWIDGHFSRLRIIETSYCDVPLEILLSVGRFDPARTELDLRALEHAGCAGRSGK